MVDFRVMKVKDIFFTSVLNLITVWCFELILYIYGQNYIELKKRNETPHDQKERFLYKIWWTNK